MAKKLKHVRFGIIGLGMMGGCHAEIMSNDKDRRFSFTAAADIDVDKAKAVGQQYDVASFTSGEEMIDSGLCDAVIVATPHYWHAPLTIRAARAGLHVMCEKPLSSTVGHARAMIAECRKRRVHLGVMLHHRARADMNTVKKLIDRGAIGEVFRAQLICSNWFRTQAYYDSGAWRGTWDGEGGGVLINQAPHHLDLFQWIGGMPKRILGMVHTRAHRIEVEDTANFLCEYGGGKVGYLYATTAEEPGMEQFTVSGDKGTIVCKGGKLLLGKLKQPVTRHIMGSKKSFAGGAEQKCTWTEVRLPKAPGGRHLMIIKAFAAHVLRGGEMYCTGREGLNELELSNAMYIAGFKHKTVELPVDAAEADRLVRKLEKERSTGRGGGLRAAADREMKKLMKKG